MAKKPTIYMKRYIGSLMVHPVNMFLLIVGGLLGVLGYHEKHGFTEELVIHWGAIWDGVFFSLLFYVIGIIIIWILESGLDLRWKSK